MFGLAEVGIAYAKLVDPGRDSREDDDEAGVEEENSLRLGGINSQVTVAVGNANACLQGQGWVINLEARLLQENKSRFKMTIMSTIIILTDCLRKTPTSHSQS